ncbi:MAG: IS200/IS605 family transposase [Prolixibacteraceae bacterium]|jgi:REP element-mobilizing transposase RayT|nr:IS200/IS605 family transposase [Prolixibacteraceae bacterium]
MPQSLSQVYVHIIFRTKHGKNFVEEEIREKLQGYIVGTISKLGIFVHEIYVNPDHAHILCSLSRTMTIATLLQKIKTSSSKWIKEKGVSNFQWQDGYSIFSVSASKVEVVKKYILNQPVHHQKMSFKDELRKFFKEYNIDFDEKYVWD